MKYKGKIQLFFWTLLFTITIPLTAHSIGRQIEINQIPSTAFPIVINQPGNYLLTTDLKVIAAEETINLYGIRIDADNVILDLNGHTLTGYGQKGIGIYVSHRKNIKIENGTLQNFLCGISLSGGNYEVLKINTLSNGLEGIKVDSSIISQCTANNNGSFGIYAKDCSIADCTANNNHSCGIFVESSTITNCKMNHNGSHGIYAEGSLIEGCKVMKNKKYGLFLKNNSSGIKNTAHNNTNGNFYGDAPSH